MAVQVQRNDLAVGVFLLATVGLVVGALIATSGWGVDHYDIFVETNDATALTVDTKVFMQGLEVGRVAGISPRPATSGRRLEFVIRLSLLDRFADGTPLRLPKQTVANVETSVLGASTLTLSIDSTRRGGGTLLPADTIRMERHAQMMEAFTALASDLKVQIQTTLTSTNNTLNAATRLADSIANAAGAGRRFITGVQPSTEKVLANVNADLDRLRHLLDSTNARTGITVRHIDALIQQSRTVMVSADSMTRLLIAMGGESRPEVRSIIVNMRNISEQMQYVLEQLGRRPMRAITGVTLPESLTAPGFARRDSLRADSLRRDSLRTDSLRRANPTPRTPNPAPR